MRVGFLHSLIRKDEKLLIAELRGRAGVELVFLDDRRLVFDFHARPEVDVVLERSINHSRAMHALRLFEGAGTPCVNSYEVRTRYVRALNMIVADTAQHVHVATSFREDPEYFQMHSTELDDTRVICSEPYPGRARGAPAWTPVPNGTVSTL